MFSIFLIILFLICLSILATFFALSVISEFRGAPYVGTRSKVIGQILAEADLKKGQYFIELGSGDGRVIIEAVQKYKVQGLGVDIHFLLVIYSQFKANLHHIDLKFKYQSMYKTDLSKADVIFMFLMPNTLTKLTNKILNECRPGTLIICHGFRFKDLDEYSVKVTPRKPFPTYYYRIK